MNDDNIIPFRKKSPSDVPQSGGKPYPPMFNIPPVTKILLALMVTLHAGLYVLDKFVLPDLMGIVILYGGFIPASCMAVGFTFWSMPLCF